MFSPVHFFHVISYFFAKFFRRYFNISSQYCYVNNQRHHLIIACAQFSCRLCFSMQSWNILPCQLHYCLIKPRMADLEFKRNPNIFCIFICDAFNLLCGLLNGYRKEFITTLLLFKKLLVFLLLNMIIR